MGSQCYLPLGRGDIGWTENSGTENAGPQKHDGKLEDKLSTTLCEVIKSPKVKNSRPVEVLKSAIGPEKVLKIPDFGQCVREKLIWPTRITCSALIISIVRQSL